MAHDLSNLADNVLERSPTEIWSQLFSKCEGMNEV